MRKRINAMNKKYGILFKGIITENPVLVLALGTCPALAQTASVTSAFGMGIAATVVLVCSNIVISLLRGIIPDGVRIPCNIVIIAGFVTVVQLVMHAYLPSLYSMMGVYLALIAVNCIILGRAEMFARKNCVTDSALDGIGMGAGFLFALLAISAIRELFGSGSLAGVKIPFIESYKIPFLVQAPGGFFVFGILIAAVNAIGNKTGKRRGVTACDSCQSPLCGKRTGAEKKNTSGD